jgi:hypothetical protein
MTDASKRFLLGLNTNLYNLTGSAEDKRQMAHALAALRAILRFSTDRRQAKR